MDILLGAPEFPFDFLHFEIVSHFHELPCKTGESTKYVDDPFNSPVFKPSPSTKLNCMGYRVGYALVERISKDFTRFTTELDCMKFICKDFWLGVFKKQVDNLRTNHQGTYVVQDNQFRPLTAIASEANAASLSDDVAQRYVAFTCGLVRGALANLGITAEATSEITKAPAVRFNINVTQGL